MKVPITQTLNTKEQGRHRWGKQIYTQDKKQHRAAEARELSVRDTKGKAMLQEQWKTEVSQSRLL